MCINALFTNQNSRGSYWNTQEFECKHKDFLRIFQIILLSKFQFFCILNRKKGEFVTLLETTMDALGSKNNFFESKTGYIRLFHRKMKHMSNHCHTLYKYKGHWTERLINKDSAFTYCTLGAFTASAKSRVYSLTTYISTKEQ